MTTHRSLMQRLGNWAATLTPDGTCVRDYVHVSDLARAHLAVLDYLRSGGEFRTLNVRRQVI